MAEITSVGEFITWVGYQLGEPMICVNVTSAQVKQQIEDSIQDFQRYCYGEGTIEDYMSLTVSAGVSAYSVSGSDIQDVVDFDLLSSYGTGVNTLFSAQLNILGNEWTPLPGTGMGLALASYETAMQYIDLLQGYFRKTFRTIYHPGHEELRLVPTPTTSGTGLLRVFKKENAIYLYNHPLVKRLVEARVMKTWGRILNKKTIQLPSGTVNGEWIYNEGKELEEKTIQDMRDESRPAQFFVG